MLISPFVQKLFSWKGRFRRSQYTLSFVYAAIALTIASWIDQVLLVPLLGISALSWIFFLLCGYATLPFTARRAHDVGLSAWWFCLPLSICYLGGMMLYAGAFLVTPESGYFIKYAILVTWWTTAVTFIFSILLITILSIYPGQKTPNRYGPVSTDWYL